MSAEPPITEPRPKVVEPLPERVRLFHIGPPKTGTTSLQHAAAARREELLQLGVRYPGEGRSQRVAIAAFLGRAGEYGQPKESERQKPPSRRQWTKLMAEINAEQRRRIWFGHEYAAGATQEQCERFAAELGPQTHVVVTLRSFTRMLPSIWQETNKTGNTESFDRFVKRMLTVPQERRNGIKFHRRHNHGGLVRRWADLVGSENVTVVVADRADHSFIMHAFEDLLDLPRDLIAGVEIPDRAVNRTMSTAEIELVRQLNKALRRSGLPWHEYTNLMVRGGVYRMLSQRQPAKQEPRLRLSKWAAGAAEEFQQASVDTLLASGVRILGEVSNLLEPAQPRVSAEENHTKVQQVPIDVAVELALGVIGAASTARTDLVPSWRGITPKRVAVDMVQMWRGIRRDAGSDRKQM